METNEKCEFCGRRKQDSKRWDEVKCVCCDVHEHQCRHRPRPKRPDLKELKHPLMNTLTGKVEILTTAEQHEFTERWREESMKSLNWIAAAPLRERVTREAEEYLKRFESKKVEETETH